VVKDDIIRAVQEFNTNGSYLKVQIFFSSLLCHKRKILNVWGDYRPISLIGCLYKIMVKLMSKRLRLVLGKVIDESQSAFLGVRNMLDGDLVANEIVDEAKLKKIHALCLR